MGKRKRFIFMALVLVLIGGTPATSYARELAKAELRVTLTIPMMQRLTVLEPAEVVFAYPQDGQALTFTDIGTIRVQSNADWALTVGAIADASLDVEVRPAGDSFARWQSVHGQGGVYVGPQGSRDISWDIRVVGNRLVASNASKEGRVQLLFTLGQL